MSDAMTCTEARSQFWLLLYGELSFDEEERVETHLDGCADCRAALEREREVHASLDEAAIEPPPTLLRECRAELAIRLESEQPPPRAGWWEQFIHMLTGYPGLLTGTAGTILRPAGALTLIALGFLAARLLPGVLSTGTLGATEAGLARIRDVQPDSGGRVRIIVDETHQRTVSGGLDDRNIQTLLLEAARDPDDSFLRQQSLNLLNTHAPSAEVRDALIYALRSDENVGVRMKAIEGLKSFAAEPEVRGALSQTLLSDANPGVRTQAIDLLLKGAGDKPDRQIVGTLQELMLREDNAYLRQRCEKILEALNASPEIY